MLSSHVIYILIYFSKEVYIDFIQFSKWYRPQVMLEVKGGDLGTSQTWDNYHM